MNRRCQVIAKQVIILSICVSFCVSLGFFIRQILSESSTTLQILQQHNMRRKTRYEAEDIVKHPRNIIPLSQPRNKPFEDKNDKSKEVLGTMKNLTQTRRPSFVNEVHFGNTRTDMPLGLKQRVQPCYKVHAFYYPWYGNPENDGRYLHWDHVYIPHWNKQEALKWRKGNHKPPEDIGANFYPSLGPYSSSDADIVDKHMEMMAAARIGVVVVSWYPPGTGDRQGNDPDFMMPLILEKAGQYSLKVCLHIEPYKGRDEVNMKDNLQYILGKYGNHSAFYRYERSDGKKLPLYYIYDSYLLQPDRWKLLLQPGDKKSVRGTDLDGIFVGLLVEKRHQFDLKMSGFDGFYTYFASNGFTYGSKWNNWKKFSMFAKSNKLLFVPSVGPGYVDTEVRPWNSANTKRREKGRYYRDSFQNAMKINPPLISITSFNEWHEGTQIEPAIPKVIDDRMYEDYGENGPYFYLNLSRQWIDTFSPSTTLD